ncbi:unnamed protein product [Mytilus coruscus]|uniref:C1q domain-containing protein n=1 Tax=Mytilus coruscus TaxID=42192 RepID=A0A6J8CYB3_MYTCO|nr:unnamed protein product [Mytilus coruscus]
MMLMREIRKNNLLNTNLVLEILESKINNSITQFEERVIQFKNRTHVDLENKLKAEEVMQNKSLSNAYSMVETQIYNLENTINFTLNRLDFISSPVAVTACVGSSRTYSSGAVVLFTEIFAVNGLSSSEMSTFKSGGKFRCTKPGLYFISTHLTSSAPDGIADLYKNNRGSRCSTSTTGRDVPQAPIQDQGQQDVATRNVGVQADNNVVNGEDFMQETTPISCNYNNDPLFVLSNNEIELFVFQDNNIHRYDVWKLGYSPICTADLDEAFQLHPDRETATLLTNGFKYGFKLQYEGPRLPFETKNLKSVIENHRASSEKVEN